MPLPTAAAAKGAAERDDLSQTVASAVDEVTALSAEIERVRRMGQRCQELESSNVFSSHEKEAFFNSYRAHHGALSAKLGGLRELVARAKVQWTAKQEAMYNLAQENLLDKNVADLWNESLAHSCQQIEQLEAMLASDGTDAALRPRR